MRIIVDLHFHSRFSRACSKDLTIPNLHKIAAFKGVQLLGTGDFTHPLWIAEIKKYLEPAEKGLYRLKTTSPLPSPHLGRGHGSVRFILTSEISSIYSQGGKTRRIHTVVVMPSIEAAEEFNKALLSKKANLSSDGRPIVGLAAKEIAKIAFAAEPRAMVIPAHIWTPWFSMFGSMSGFDSVEECFEEQAEKIFAAEMGLSSDADMNWRVSNLDRLALLASSDAHSLSRIAREGNVFDLASPQDFSYEWVYNTIKGKNPEKFLFTIKYYPEEGRYHYDGHVDCGFSCLPAQTKKLKGLCPKCGRKLTVGVLNRVEQLANRPEGFVPPNSIPTRHLVPLEEVISDALGVGVKSKTVQNEYQSLVRQAGGEFEALLDLPYEELQQFTQPVVVEGIRRNREEKLHIEPGYDGKYGVVKIFTDEEREAFQKSKQESLF